MIELKIVLVGPAESGKTAYLNRFIHGDFDEHYKPTVGCEVHPITFNTSIGEIRVNFWDMAGQDKYGGFAFGHAIAADCAIVFRDSADSGPSNTEIASGIAASENVKKVYVCSKCDLDFDSTPTYVRDQLFYQISAKSNYNFEKPILSLFRQVTGNNNLTLVETMA